MNKSFIPAEQILRPMTTKAWEALRRQTSPPPGFLQPLQKFVPHPSKMCKQYTRLARHTKFKSQSQGKYPPRQTLAAAELKQLGQNHKLCSLLSLAVHQLNTSAQSCHAFCTLVLCRRSSCLTYHDLCIWQMLHILRRYHYHLGRIQLSMRVNDAP